MKILKIVDIKKLREEYLNKQNNIDLLTKDDIQKPCLDHDHITGFCRAVLDYNSNQFLGKVESAWKRFGYKYSISMLPYVLHNMAEYLEKDYDNNPMHPKHVKILINRFRRRNISEQDTILRNLKIKPKKSKNEKVKQYREYFNKSTNLYKFKKYGI